MAAADQTIPLRSAVIVALKLSPAIKAIVGDRVYIEEPPAEPAWPWIRWASPPATMPYETMTEAGSEFRLQIDAFAYGPGEDAVRKLARLIVVVLDDAVLPMKVEVDELGVGERTPPNPTLLDMTWMQTHVVRDIDVAGAYHAIVEFTATTGA